MATALQSSEGFPVGVLPLLALPKRQRSAHCSSLCINLQQPVSVNTVLHTALDVSCASATFITMQALAATALPACTHAQTQRACNSRQQLCTSRCSVTSGRMHRCFGRPATSTGGYRSRHLRRAAQTCWAAGNGQSDEVVAGQMACKTCHDI